MNIFEYDGEQFDKKLDEIIRNIDKSDFLQELKEKNMINNPILLEKLKNKIKNTSKETFEEAFETIDKKDFNEYLISQYPWLQLRNVWNNKYIENYEFTWLDDLPSGWRKSFGLKMIEELDQILRKAHYQNEYKIVQIKEKWGSLCWYDNGIPKNIYKEYNSWLNRYEELSKHTCIICGEQGELTGKGLIVPLCEKCKKDNER